jgi:glutathione S-transferase
MVRRHGAWHGVRQRLSPASFASVFRQARFSSDDSAHAAIRATGMVSVTAHLADIDARLAGRDTIMDAFSIADLYPLVFRRWAVRIGIEMGGYPNLVAHAERIAARPAAARAIAQESIRLDG